MDTIKNLLAKYATPLLVKYVLRGITYGFAALAARYAIEAPSSDTQAQLAGWIASAVSTAVALGIDYLQHKYNTK